MNERERVLAVFQRRVPFPNLTLGSPSSDGKGEVPDQTPWYADLSYWYSGQKAMGRLPGKYEGDEGYLRLHQDAGAGIYLYAPGVWKEEFDESIQTEQKKEENRIISTIFTPLGKLTAIQEYLSQSFTSAYREHYIKKKEDLKIMRYLFTHRRITSCFDDFLRIDSLWNGWGLPVVLAPCCVSPLQTLLTRWAGVETTVNLLVEGREELEEAIIELQEADNEIFKIISQAPGQMVVFGENLSGEITGQKLMAQYEIPY